MDRLYAFVRRMCEEYSIDETHDSLHSKDCMDFATAIMDNDCSDEERKMILYAAALHDCVDKKYTNVDKANRQVYVFLKSEMWSDENATVLLAIINTMSYSYLKSNVVDGCPVFPEHGIWQRAYHTVRQADLLCSYRVERCYKYQKRIAPTLSEEDCWDKVRKFFLTRVFLYIADRWLISPKAILATPPLIREANECIRLEKLE